jgi:outer membrane protein assembly factor BamB
MGKLFNRRWRLVGCLAVLAVALPLASASSGLAATSTSWSAPYFNFGNTNYNTSEATLGVSNVASLSQHSTYLLPAGALDLSNVLSVGTHQYVEYSTENQAGQFYEHVTAINMATGKAKWTTSSLAVAGLATPYTGQPGPIAYQGGVIYASAYDHLDAVSATTGAILWSFVPSQTTGDLHLLAVANGTVFIRDGDGSQDIDAVNATTGALEWTFATGENFPDAAYSSGYLYVASGDRTTYAINATTGVARWSRTLVFYNGFMAVANGVLYEYSNTTVNALKPSNGHVIWTRTLPAGYNSPPIIGDGSAFFTDGYEMSALSLAGNGVLEWSNYGQTPGNCPMVGANGVIYCAASGGDVEAYNAASGQSLWNTTVPGGVIAGPIVVNGCVYLATTQSSRDELLSYCA